MILTKPLDFLLITALILPFFSYFIKKNKKVIWIRNIFIVGSLFLSLYFLTDEGVPKNPLINIKPLSIYFSFIFLVFGLIILIYSFNKKKKSNFYSLSFFILAGLLGVTFAADFFTLFVFWELLLISSCSLIYYEGKKELISEAGLKYIFMSVAGSASLLFAISLLYGLGGTLNFVQLAEILPKRPILKIVIALILAGFGVESLIFPFHWWAPDVYQVSETTVSTIFAALLSKIGIFGIIKVFYLIFPKISWTKPVALLALVSMTFGNFMALTQDNIKRLFAFSSIGHLGFILFAISLGNKEGLIAGLFHILNHTIVMSSLFLSSGELLGNGKLEDLQGIYKNFSVPGMSFFFSCLAATGIPPFNLFISELLILSAGIGKNWIMFSGILLFNMFLASVVFLRILKTCFEDRKNKKIKQTNEFFVIFPLLLLLSLIILWGIFPEPIITILNLIV